MLPRTAESGTMLHPASVLHGKGRRDRGRIATQGGNGLDVRLDARAARAVGPRDGEHRGRVGGLVKQAEEVGDEHPLVLLPHVAQDGRAAEAHVPQLPDVIGIHAAQSHDLAVYRAPEGGCLQRIHSESRVVSGLGDAVEDRAEEEVIADVAPPVQLVQRVARAADAALVSGGREGATAVQVDAPQTVADGEVEVLVQRDAASMVFGNGLQQGLDLRFF